MGSYTLDSLLNVYPDLIGVSLHSYGATDAMHFLQLDTIATPYAPGAPLGGIDRIYWGGSWSYVAQLYQSWDSLVQVRLAIPPQLSVSLTATWNSATRNISVQLTTNILSNMTTGDYRFNLYVIEDSVTGSGSGYDQSNTYTSSPGNPFFGLGDPIVGFVHRHVVRAILPVAWGSTGIIPSTPMSGQNFSTAINYTLPANYNENRIKLVAFVSNYTTNHQGDKVLNADEINLPLQTGVNDASAPLGMTISIYPNPSAGGEFTVYGLPARLRHSGWRSAVQLSVYNVLGEKIFCKTVNSKQETINLSEAKRGIYFLQVTADGAVIAREKLVIQ